MQDSPLRVRFYVEGLIDQEKSRELGRPFKRDAEMVEIHNKLDPKSVVRRRVKEQDKINFPQEWARFQRTQPGMVDGTPLSVLPMCTPGEVDNLSEMEIYTLEDLTKLTPKRAESLGVKNHWIAGKAYLEAAAAYARKEEPEELPEPVNLNDETLVKSQGRPRR